MVRSAASRAALNASHVSLMGEGTRGDGGIVGGTGGGGDVGGAGGGGGDGGGTVHTVSEKLAHGRAPSAAPDARAPTATFPEQHLKRPPGALPQPFPPHWPHSEPQQTEPPEPKKPWSHQVLGVLHEPCARWRLLPWSSTTRFCVKPIS